MFKRAHHYILIVLALIIYYLYTREYYGTGLDAVFGFLFLFVLYAATLLYTIYWTIKDKRPISWIRKGAVLWMGILLACSFPAMSWYVDTDGGKKVTMSARSYTDMSLVSLDLRTDQTFKLFTGGPFGGTYYRGAYQLEKDTLRIENNALKYLYPTLTFCVKTDSLQRRYFEPVCYTKADSLNIEFHRLEIRSSFR